MSATPRLRIAAAAGSALMLAACSSPSAGTPAPAVYELSATTPRPASGADKVVWATHAEPFSLDYAYAFDYPDNQILANVCESLLRWNDDLSMSPGLASDYANPTPTTWVYTIREGVVFHDGTPLTAADVVASLKRHLNPQVGSFWFSVYANVEKVEQTGPNEVTVTTKIPDMQFNQSMTGAAGVVESAATLAEAAGNYGNAAAGVNCTGPFELDSWQTGERLTLRKFDGYWDKDLEAQTKQLDFVFMPDAVARANAWKSGDVDGGWMLPSNAIPELQASGAGQVYFGKNTSVNSLIVSDLEGPLGDPRVRKALLMAIDRDGLVQAAEQGYAKRTEAATAGSVWSDATEETVQKAFGGLQQYPYDLEEASRLVEEAGAAGQEITIATAPLGNNFAVVSQATAAAAESIGLKARIESVTPNAYTSLFSDPNAREGIDLFFTSWYLSTADPLEMFSILRTGEFSNYGQWSNPEFDQLVTDAISTPDPAERFAKAAEAQAIVNGELPWLPLYETPNTLWMGNGITGPSPSINYLYYPWAAKIGAK